MSTAPHADREALAGLIAGALCIGFAPIFVRLVDVGYTAAAFWRVALSLPFLFALWFPRRRDPDSEQEPAALRWLWLGGAFFAGDLAVWHQSILHTSVANATLLTNLGHLHHSGLILPVPRARDVGLSGRFDSGPVRRRGADGRQSHHQP